MFVYFLARIIIGLVVGGFINILYSLYKVRMHVRRVQSEYGVVMRKSKFPSDAHTQWLPLLFFEEYPELAKKGILYLDVWPISEPLLSIYNPDLVAQVTDGNFRKSDMMMMEIGPATGGKDILTAEGQEWKRARAMFNPGFAAKNLMSMIPEFVEEIKIFQDKMRNAARTGKIIKLEDWTTSLAVDVISRAVLGVRLDAQIKTPPLVETMQSQVPLLYNKLDFFKLFNPIRYYKLWSYRRRFRNQMVPYIRDAARNYDISSGPKTVLKLALKERAKETKDLSKHMDSFIEDQVGQFWIFLFAGHDTTAITLSFCLYLLSRNPDKAAKIRAEHDQVLGPDPSQAAEVLTDNPNLVNQLPYTTAVFKETLRLCPPVSGGVRSTPEGFCVTDPVTGQIFPTSGFMVNSAGAVMQRLPEYWPEATKFLPERWLVKNPEDPLYPRKGAWRPFEAGQRNCIGQELVSLEARLVLALTMREFDIIDAYPDDGPSFEGEKAYQVDLPESIVTAHAKDGMPVKVHKR